MKKDPIKKEKFKTKRENTEKKKKKYIAPSINSENFFDTQSTGGGDLRKDYEGCVDVDPS